MKNYSRIAIAAAAMMLLGSCASYHMRQGNRMFRDLAYTSAIVEYQKALGKKDFPKGRLQLAECFRLTNDLQKAEAEYAIVVKLPEAEPIHYFRYAQLLMRTANYDSARVYFDRYLASKPDDAAARKLRNSCDSILSWQEDSSRYFIQSTNLNSGQSNFSPAWYHGGVVFVSDRSESSHPLNYEWTGRPFLNLYYAQADRQGNFSTPVLLKGDLNGIYNEGPANFTSTEDTIYFTRNNYIKKKVKKSADDVVILKLYEAVRKDTTYMRAGEFPFNSDNYSMGHPALSSDGNTMYFVSDKDSGFGGADIYVTHRVNGEWKTPENLGQTINTPYNDVFPTLWKDTVLYFSSEGHYGMGGLDLFRSVKETNGWSTPKNLGYPMNSSYDDFGIAVKENGNTGLFSSNRDTKNTTLDNIYSFTFKELKFDLVGKVLDRKSQEPIEGAGVLLKNIATMKNDSVYTGPDGKFNFQLDPESKYALVGSKEQYFTKTEPISTVGKRKPETINQNLELDKIVIDSIIVLKNIYYDLDKWDIRPDAARDLDTLLDVMKDNPKIRIELSSHTDSRADDKYNLKLSQRRADAAVNYLVTHGIASDRMIAKGYGETRLMNQCSNGVACTEEQHQLNRRTEFKVISMGKK